MKLLHFIIGHGVVNLCSSLVGGGRLLQGGERLEDEGGHVARLAQLRLRQLRTLLAQERQHL